MTLTKIKTSQASSPLIIKIQSIENSFTQMYTVFVKILHEKEVYKDISKVQEMMVVSNQIVFKIEESQFRQNRLKQSALMTKSKVSESSVKNSQTNGTILLGVVQIKQNVFCCHVKNDAGQIKLKGKVLNQNQGIGIVFDLSISQIENYQAFYNFRKKYKTMENITRKINFNLDHRLKIVEKDKKPLYFSLEQDDNQHHFFSCSAELTVSIEEIYSVQDYYDIHQIFEEKICLKQLIESSLDKQYCHRLQLCFEKLKLFIKADIVKNQNLGASQLVSIRIFQTSSDQKRVYVGTNIMKRTFCLASLIENRFFDYEYGYLCNNLKQFAQKSNQNDQQGCDNLQKLTKCFPKYPHFINQSILDVKNCQSIQIETQSGCEYSIPFVYCLKGYNIFHCEKGWVKFYIEFQNKEQQANYIRQNINQSACFGDRRRIYEMKVHNFWNLSSVQQQKFEIKIICNNLMYSIPFQTSVTEVSAFKKQSRNLQNCTEYNQMMVEKFYLLKQGKGQNNKNILQIIKTQSIKDLYMLDFSSIASVSFEISSGNRMLMTGFLTKNEILKANQKRIKILISSANQQKKVVVQASFQEIQYQNKSLRSIYNFRYQLYYADDAMVPAEAVYDLQIRRVSDDKKFKKRINPEQRTQDYQVMKDFYEQGLFTKYLEQQVLVLLRKMHYNQETNIFDNQQLVNKKVIINPQPQRLVQKQTKQDEAQAKTIFLRINDEAFNSIEIDFYDSTIKQRLRLIIQVSLRKFSFLDQQNARYVIRIPQYLWKLNTAIKEKEKFEFEVLLSHKKKRGDKIEIQYGDLQEFRLPRYNYKDAFSIKVKNQNERIGFSRVIDAVKIRCDVLKQSIGWIKQSDWYFGVMNIESEIFYFLIKTQFDPNAEQSKSDGGSARTVSHETNKREQKVNNLAKTMKSMDILKLKLMKNDLTIESRHLTQRIVQRQEKIAQLNKKIYDLNQNIRKKREKEHLIREQQKSRKVNTKQHLRLKKLYRQICECGTKNPQFNGFCASCLSKMKQRYLMVLKQHKESQIKFEKIVFQKKNKRLKLIKAKEKLRNYYDRLNAGQDINGQSAMDMAEHLEQKQLKRRIEELKIDLFTIEQQANTTREMSKLQQQRLHEKVKNESQEIELAVEQLKELKVKMQHIKERGRMDINFR